MQRPTSPQVIRVIDVPKGTFEIPPFNRHLTFEVRIEAVKNGNISGFWKKARCSAAGQVTEKVTHFDQSRCLTPGKKRFVLIQFRDSPETDEVLRSFLKARLHAATFEETLQVMAASKSPEKTVVVLGSSNKSSATWNYRKKTGFKGWWYRRTTTLAEHLSLEASVPLIDWRDENSTLHISKAGSKWQNHCTFIAVLDKLDEYDPLEISLEEYASLPTSKDLVVTLAKAEIGTYHLDPWGNILQVVKGEDMLAHQHAGTAVPERGFRKYYPVLA